VNLFFLHAEMEAYAVVEVLALIFWSLQLAPQVRANWLNPINTRGLSSTMMLCWSLGSLATAIYWVGGTGGRSDGQGIVVDVEADDGANQTNVGGQSSDDSSMDVLFILQPNLFLVFSCLCYGQCIYYRQPPQHQPLQQDQQHERLQLQHPDRHPHQRIDINKDDDDTIIAKSSFIGAIILVTFIVISEVIGGVLLRRRCGYIPSSTDNDTCNILFNSLGILSTIFFGLGFIPQFYTIYQAGYVEGVSLLFLCIDMTRAILSILALVLLALNGPSSSLTSSSSTSTSTSTSTSPSTSTSTSTSSVFNPVAATCYIIVFLCDLSILILSMVLRRPSHGDDEVANKGTNKGNNEGNNERINEIKGRIDDGNNDLDDEGDNDTKHKDIIVLTSIEMERPGGNPPIGPSDEDEDGDGDGDMVMVNYHEVNVILKSS
jgi:hypothetical protein